ncbi:MAG: aminopeptidase P family protein [Coriobacteriia bacterium]|nr:aminopeptidase P family protein [Coriobacteriia bacterium]MBS5477236.1 aminopeptidase P family protein [Coriobacteriia bacterium]
MSSESTITVDYAARLARVRANLAAMGLAQMLVSDPMSICWLTGFYVDPGERFHGLVIREDAEPVLVVNDLFPAPAGLAVAQQGYRDEDDPLALVRGLVDHAAPLGCDKDLAARFLLPLRDAGAASDFVLGSAAVDGARSIKDAQEQELMRRASATNDKAMGVLRGLVHEGVTEREIADQLLDIYRSLGAQAHSFPPIVSFGAHGADPHHGPDDTPLGPRDSVLFDVGCVQDGYCSDMTRVFFFRDVTDEERTVYETVRRANEAAAAVVRPGVLFSDVDKAARDAIEEAGYGQYFTHRLGHQIGMNDHEPGDVSAVHHEPMQAGVCHSIEPGIYLPGKFGVRIEDLCIVQEDGGEIINHYPHNLDVIA